MKYLGTQALYNHMTSAQDYSVNVTNIKNVLDMNHICISTIRLSQASDFKFFCP